MRFLVTLFEFVLKGKIPKLKGKKRLTLLEIGDKILGVNVNWNNFH